MTEEKLLTNTQAAAYLGLSPATLATWRSRFPDGSPDGLPALPYLKRGRHRGGLIRYRLSDLQRFYNAWWGVPDRNPGVTPSQTGERPSGGTVVSL